MSAPAEPLHLSKTPEGLAAIQRNTRGLEPGWYILEDGFFWHDRKVRTTAGPFTTQDDAMRCRDALEKLRGAYSLWIDEVHA